MSDRTEKGSIICEHIIDSCTKALSRFRSIEVVWMRGTENQEGLTSSGWKKMMDFYLAYLSGRLWKFLTVWIR